MAVTKAEEELFYVVKGVGGSFQTALFELICKADRPNQERLRLAFPSFVDVVIRYQTERGYWEDLQKELKDKL